MRSINLGRWSRRVERYFNIKGGGGLMDVEPAVRLILPIASGVEDRYLEGWNRFAVAAGQIAVAAQNSRTRIRNPSASNVMLVLEQLSAWTTTSTDFANVSWGPSTTDLGSLITLTFTRMDPRGNATPTAIVSTAAQAAGGQPLLERPYLVSQAVDFIQNPNQEITILPGQALDVQANAVNTALIVNYMWRERAMETSELT